MIFGIVIFLVKIYLGLWLIAIAFWVLRMILAIALFIFKIIAFIFLWASLWPLVLLSKFFVKFSPNSFIYKYGTRLNIDLDKSLTF